MSKELQKYLKKNKVEDLLTSLIESVCKDRPKDVRSYLIKALQSKDSSSKKAKGKKGKKAEPESESDSDSDSESSSSRSSSSSGSSSSLGSSSSSSSISREGSESESDSEDEKSEQQRQEEDEEHISKLISNRDADARRRRYSMTDRRQAVSSETFNPSGGDVDHHPTRFIHKPEEVKIRLRKAFALNVLFSHLEPNELSIIIDALEEKNFYTHEVIIKQGEEGSEMYMVDYGTCDVFVKSPASPATLSAPHGKKVATVGSGGMFGELALMYGTPRAASIVAVTDCRLWAIDRETFRRILLKSMINKRKMYDEFLGRVPILQSLNEYERLTIADALEREEFAVGTKIIREGDSGDEFFIILNGSVEVTKRNRENNKEVVVNSLKEGDFFGEMALMTQKPRAATVRALESTTVVKLNRKAFERILGPLEDILKRNMESYKSFTAAM